MKEMFNIKKLFLCHFNEDAPEIDILANELRLRGIIPWVDKQGGFLLGDSSASSARRAIREDCFGLLFYASPSALNRPFISRVELHEAVNVKDSDPNFLLVAIPRNMSFSALKDQTLDILGEDLSSYHSIPVTGIDIEAELAFIAKSALERVFATHSANIRADNYISLQFSTRDSLPTESDDILCIDASRVLAGEKLSNPESWTRIYHALVDVKEKLSKSCGRPRIKIHGSKHLTAAYIFGSIFSASSGFKLDIRCGDDWWSSDVEPSSETFLETRYVDGDVESDCLFIELTTTDKQVRDSVRAYERSSGIRPHVYLRFKLSDEGLRRFSNAECQSIALQIRRELSSAKSRYPISKVHLFSAIPQGLAFLIGHQLNAQKPIQLYEFDGVNYIQSGQI